MTVSNQEEGGDALIHLRVPAAVKARWVRKSRAVGKRLTDWIVERVEEKKMTVYPMDPAIGASYKGAGLALAAITGGQVVALRYIRDVAPTVIADHADGVHGGFFVRQWLATAAAGPIVRELQALGDVSAGMVSAWEFVEL